MTPEEMELSTLYLLRHSRNYLPPVNLDTIPALIGVRLLTEDDLDDVMPHTLPAFCIRLELRTYIMVNQRDPLTRQRFSFSHEVKHALHDHAEVAYYTSEAGIMAGAPNAHSERQANIYASLFLMPTTWIQRDAPHYHTLKQMADRYGVSRRAMAFRLKDMGLSTI